MAFEVKSLREGRQIGQVQFAFRARPLLLAGTAGLIAKPAPSLAARE